MKHNSKNKGSYRTYEEWKLDEANFVFSSRFWVLTVPLRNGNFVALDHLFCHNRVLTVPMRNGNV